MLLPLDKDKKSESKSQLPGSEARAALRCCRWTKIKNLKANHNDRIAQIADIDVVAVGQR